MFLLNPCVEKPGCFWDGFPMTLPWNVIDLDAAEGCGIQAQVLALAVQVFELSTQHTELHQNDTLIDTSGSSGSSLRSCLSISASSLDLSPL